jgi:steroid 5-alpha reductase family enzyme
MNIFLISGIVLAIYFSVFFVIGQILKNNSIVDFGWGLGLVLLALIQLFTVTPLNLSAIIVTLLVTIWGIRLSYHIAKRNFKRGEDFRYLNMRKKWGKYPYINAFFKVYMLQALFMYIVATPIMLVFETGINQLNLITLLGILVWILGFYFEAVGDKQLKDFIKKPENKGKIMKSGLWRYTRHPNYFGEAIMWWGIFLIVLPSAYGIAAIMSPLIITYLLIFVSGIPMLEKKYENNEEFKDYARVTSKFIPLPPKKQN